MPRYPRSWEDAKERAKMNRSDIEQLTDELIGQAVLMLLKRKAAVNSMALLTQLRVMQDIEVDPRRRDVFPLIIAYLDAVMSEKTHAKQQPKNSGQTDILRMLSGENLKPEQGKTH